ncbi:MAG TPA: four helix bundle protein [Terriglobales bacterium]|nr:four helix bundle protein [Terriglobales bacterium]
MQNFRNLSVWEKAHHFTLQVYQITERFPRTEMFGLTSQLRRASSSIAINLAEGCGRTQLEFARFVQIAFGSASEVEYELLLAHDLGFISDDGYERLKSGVVEIKRMLNSLLRTIQTDARGSQAVSAQLPKRL